MARRKILLMGFGILVAMTIFVVIGQSMRSGPPNPRPPELGGQRVPEVLFDIRFDRDYDLFCSFFSDEPTVYRNCRIQGFTGSEQSSEARHPSGFGVIGVASGSASGYSYRNHFDHWLVLRLEDGRLAYVPPGAVKYIEEALPKRK